MVMASDQEDADTLSSTSLECLPDSSEIDKPYDPADPIDEIDSDPEEESELVSSPAPSSACAEPPSSPTATPSPTGSSSKTAKPSPSPTSSPTSPTSHTTMQRGEKSKSNQSSLASFVKPGPTVPGVICFSTGKKKKKKSRKASETSPDHSAGKSSSPVHAPRAKEKEPSEKQNTTESVSKGISFQILGTKFGTATKSLGAWEESETPETTEPTPKTDWRSAKSSKTDLATDWWSLSEPGKAAALADAKAVKAVCRALRDPALLSEKRVSELLDFISSKAYKYCFIKSSQLVILTLLECVESRREVEQLTEALDLRETSATSMAKDPVASEVLVALLDHKSSRGYWLRDIARWVLNHHKTISDTEHGVSVVAAVLRQKDTDKGRQDRERLLQDFVADFEDFKEAISSPREAILVQLLRGSDWAAGEAIDRLLYILESHPQVFFTPDHSEVAAVLAEECGGKAASAVKAAALQLKTDNNTALRFATSRCWDELV